MFPADFIIGVLVVCRNKVHRGKVCCGQLMEIMMLMIMARKLIWRANTQICYHCLCVCVCPTLKWMITTRAMDPCIACEYPRAQYLHPPSSSPPPPRIRRQRSVLRGSESLLLIPTCAHVSVCACLCSVERVIWLCCVCVCANVWKALTHIYILHSIAPTLLVSVCVFAHYLRRRRRRKFTDCKFVRRKKMFSYHVRAPPATAVTTVQSNGRKMSQLLADLFSTL